MSPHPYGRPEFGWGISERFLASADEARAGDPVLLPSRLAAVAAELIGAAVGLSVMSPEFRVPLGSSSAAASRIEQLQFTTQQGPCWNAVQRDLPLRTVEADLVRRWPQFHAFLVRDTGFRSVASVPLRLGRGAGGAMDLYFDSPGGAAEFDLRAGTVVAAHLCDYLNRAADDHPLAFDGVAGPAWAQGRAARGRIAVWLAVGMVMSEGPDLSADSLALLRAAAFSADRSLDELAADLLDGRLRPADLVPER